MADGGVDRCMSETDNVSIHSSLNSRHSRDDIEGVSVQVCHIMTLLGYGEEIRRRRVELYRKSDMFVNAGFLPGTFITAGSKAEGLTCWNESDSDRLILLNGVLCVEAGINLQTIPDDIQVYRMDTRVYPGHCRMLRERCGSHTSNLRLEHALCDDGKGNALLSSGLWLDDIEQILNRLVLKSGPPFKRMGPSIPCTNLGINYDLVFAIRCHCPSILQRWAQRSRLWPPPEVVHKVVSLGSVVTPVGFNGSEYKYLEWRICFNMGETEIVTNLNMVQAKLYVILKMIVKEVLKPSNKEITSYVLKNIILWQAERNPSEMFQERNLIHWLHDALRTLRTAISSTQLPYYMIPERNLMAACGLQEVQQRKWVADITDMIGEGPRVVMRLPKIRQAVIGHPEPLLWFSRKRMEIELLMFELSSRFMRCSYENCESKITMVEIMRHIDEIFSEFSIRMIMEGGTVYDVKDSYSRYMFMLRVLM
ncbi:uncharacterized protein LOC127850361 isoform X2 [Dreissena polymorpha]|uniref:uncharacterized protein LOC127850361 isoform X2 n=1 Tax=Dreissena polymorpha TaxID=45954 RepID=UPI002264B6C7|nr:uncharacterized protein LOC127850361 isoform X2 [Dreissena polymorpha]